MLRVQSILHDHTLRSLFMNGACKNRTAVNQAVNPASVNYSMNADTGFLVFDLEATCWADRPDDVNEIIEIGAVVTDAAGRPTSEFQAFVRPKLNPELSDFCRKLTSITQDDVDAAPPFPGVAARFREWARAHESPLPASWGAYDRKQLHLDCTLHGVDYPLSDQHINLKNAFAHVFRCRRMGMARALRKLGITLQGTHHRGIDDARNITLILQQMLNAAPDPTQWGAGGGGIVNRE
jgi:inhibitor of KinA sporulation pathway (predicted exonuclease)